MHFMFHLQVVVLQKIYLQHLQFIFVMKSVFLELNIKFQKIFGLYLTDTDQELIQLLLNIL